MEQLGEWLAGSFEGWVGIAVTLATLGSGGYIGGRQAAVARSRHSDRSQLLDWVYNAWFYRIADWTGDAKIELLELALRLPHVDRCIVLKLLTGETPLHTTDGKPARLQKVLQYEVNPEKFFPPQLWRKFLIVTSSPWNSRKQIGELHSTLIMARQADPEWGDQPALDARKVKGLDSLF